MWRVHRCRRPRGESDAAQPADFADRGGDRPPPVRGHPSRPLRSSHSHTPASSTTVSRAQPRGWPKSAVCHSRPRRPGSSPPAAKDCSRPAAEDGPGSRMVTNVHQRRYAAASADVAALVLTLASTDDQLRLRTHSNTARRELRTGAVAGFASCAGWPRESGASVSGDVSIREPERIACYLLSARARAGGGAGR